VVYVRSDLNILVSRSIKTQNVCLHVCMYIMHLLPRKWPILVFIQWRFTASKSTISRAEWKYNHNFCNTYHFMFFLGLFFLICIVGGGVQIGSTRHVGHLLAYCTCSGWLWGWRIWWNEWQGKPKYSEKTCPDATLSTANPTWPDPGLNPGRRCGNFLRLTNAMFLCLRSCCHIFTFSMAVYATCFGLIRPSSNIFYIM
jgi:hypothetical protein